MVIKIKELSGRLGNNLLQLKNAINYCIENNHSTLLIPKNPFFNNTLIYIDDNKYNEENTLEMEFNNECENFNPKFIDYIKKILRKLFIPYNILLHEKKADNYINNDHILIHIRSGDIFHETNTNYNYIQPPFSYYEEIISKYKKFSIISECNNNPMIYYLENKYPGKVKEKFRERKLIDDIKIFLSQKNIIFSYGTFCPTLALLISDNIKNIFCPSWEDCDLIRFDYPNINIKLYHNNKYLEKLDYKWNLSKKTLMFLF